MPQSLSIIIVEKGGSLKQLTVKDYKVEELYKKCGFKKSEDFKLHVEWNVKLEGQKYLIQMYGKLDGKAGSENKYDFPPPIDNNLYFGSCALVGIIKDNLNNKSYVNLSIDLWKKMYDKLFGGFEDLTTTCKEDEEEEDELENIPNHMKTKKGGYLKDGFVVDSSDTEPDGEDDEDGDLENFEETDTSDIVEWANEFNLEEIGSELSEESYDE
jgi:hypothetical protein